jgi:hypothetical protein
MDGAARRVSRKVAWRLIPFLILCFVISFLDRINVGFAALTMNRELGLTARCSDSASASSSSATLYSRCHLI